MRIAEQALNILNEARVDKLTKGVKLTCKKQLGPVNAGEVVTITAEYPDFITIDGNVVKNLGLPMEVVKKYFEQPSYVPINGATYVTTRDIKYIHESDFKYYFGAEANVSPAEEKRYRKLFKQVGDYLYIPKGTKGQLYYIERGKNHPGDEPEFVVKGLIIGLGGDFGYEDGNVFEEIFKNV